MGNNPLSRTDPLGLFWGRGNYSLRALFGGEIPEAMWRAWPAYLRAWWRAAQSHGGNSGGNQFSGAEMVTRIVASEGIGLTALGIAEAGRQLMMVPHPAARLGGFALEGIALGFEALALDLLPISGVTVPVVPDNDPGE